MNGNQFEHTVVRVVDESPFVEEAIWEQEKDGYELVTAYPQDGCVRLYFKRPRTCRQDAQMKKLEKDLAQTLAQRDSCYERLKAASARDAPRCRPELTAWVQERLDNCQRIAGNKDPGADRDGWLEDAAYFSEILAVLSKPSASTASRNTKEE